MKSSAPLLVRSPLHDALFAVSMKALTATTGTVSGVWGEHKALVLSTAAVLALLAPVFLRLPRKAGITAAVLVVALLQMAFDMPCAASATLQSSTAADARRPTLAGQTRCSWSHRLCSASRVSSD